MYQPHHRPQLHQQRLRGVPYHWRTWGNGQGRATPVVLLHGWMDVGASWQFMVDALPADFVASRPLIAPDWRGFGRSQPSEACDNFHFMDYVADLDALVQAVLAQADTTVDLVGHSMGGNVAMLYAAARPARVRRVVNLEGFGLPQVSPSAAPQRLSQWLDALAQCRAGQLDLRPYPSREAVAARLRKTNPRIPAERALWLAGEWAAPDAQGQWHIQGSAAHKVPNPHLFRTEEYLAHYRAITAPVLMLEAEDDSLQRLYAQRYTRAEFAQRLSQVAQVQTQRIADCGHMLQHDQPQAVAQAVHHFLQF